MCYAIYFGVAVVGAFWAGIVEAGTGLLVAPVFFLTKPDFFGLFLSADVVVVVPE